MNGIVLRIPASSYSIARKGRPILLRVAMGIFGYVSQESVVAPVPGDNQSANGAVASKENLDRGDRRTG